MFMTNDLKGFVSQICRKSISERNTNSGVGKGVSGVITPLGVRKKFNVEMVHMQKIEHLI